MALKATTPICFWCRNPKHESTLVHVKYLTDEVASAALLNYDPCDSCLDTIHAEKTGTGSRGLWVMEVLPYPNVLPQQPPIGEGQPAYPTGRWAVIEVAAAMAMGFFPVEALQQKRCLLSREGFDMMMNFGKPAGSMAVSLEDAYKAWNLKVKL